MTATTPDPWACPDHDPTCPHPGPAGEGSHADLDREIACHRRELVAALDDALRALSHAATAVAALTGERLHDADFAEGAAGHDVAALLAGSLRRARAAHAITGHVNDRA